MYNLKDEDSKLAYELRKNTKIDSKLIETEEDSDLVEFVEAIYDSAKGLNLKKVIITVDKNNLHILLTASNTSEVSVFNFKNVFPYVQFQLKDCKMVNAKHNNGGYNDYLQATFYLQVPLSFIKSWKDYE